MNHILSELSAMMHPSWVALHGLAHSIIELCKPLHQDKAVIHEVVTDFLFLGSKITADGDCSHEIRRQLLLGRQESYDKPRQCAESRDITADKGPYI